MGRVRWILAALLLSCGASPRRASWPVVPVLSDETAAAHACRFALEVVELEDTRAPAGSGTQMWARPDDRRQTELRSGELSYVVRSVVTEVSVPTGGVGARRTWEVSDGTRTLQVGDDVNASGSPELIGDGEGALLMTVWERGEFPSYVVVDAGRVVHRGQLRSLDQLLDLDRTDTGWIFTRLDGNSRAMVVVGLERDGDSRELVRIGDRENPITQGLAREAHGGFAVAYGQGSTVGFAAHTPDGEGRFILIDEDRGASGRLLPLDMIAVEDGWWLVIEASWQEQHSSAGPPEWRFVHIDLRGEPIARGRVRWGDYHPYGGNLRVENGRLRARFLQRGPTEYTQFDVAVAPRGPCPPPSFGRCEPRTWSGERVETTRREWTWTWAEQATLVSRRDEDGRTLWTARLTEQRVMAPPLSANGRVFIVTHRSGSAHLVTLDVEDGRQLADLELGLDPNARRAPIHLSIDGRAVVSACVGLRGSEPQVVLATEVGLSIHDGRGARLLTIPGNFQDCALAMLDDRAVLAGARVRTLTSTLPWASIEVFVLSSDARSQVARHVTDAMGGDLHSIAVGDGATIVWSDLSGWNFTVWAFDRAARPRTPPLHLATLYGLRRVSVEETVFGPSLLWSRWDEHGVVPLCHAEERGEPAHPSQFGGSVTLPM